MDLDGVWHRLQEQSWEILCYLTTAFIKSHNRGFQERSRGSAILGHTGALVAWCKEIVKVLISVFILLKKGSAEQKTAGIRKLSEIIVRMCTSSTRLEHKHPQLK